MIDHASGALIYDHVEVLLCRLDGGMPHDLLEGCKVSTVF